MERFLSDPLMLWASPSLRNMFVGAANPYILDFIMLRIYAVASHSFSSISPPDIAMKNPKLPPEHFRVKSTVLVGRVLT